MHLSECHPPCKVIKGCSLIKGSAQGSLKFRSVPERAGWCNDVPQAWTHWALRNPCHLRETASAPPHLSIHTKNENPRRSTWLFLIFCTSLGLCWAEEGRVNMSHAVQAQQSLSEVVEGLCCPPPGACLCYRVSWTCITNIFSVSQVHNLHKILPADYSLNVHCFQTPQKSSSLLRVWL